jgi:hypothetical protein
MYSSVALCSQGEDFDPPRGERHAFLRELCRTKCPPLNVIIMREQLNVKQSQAISETPAKGGGGLVETCFSSLGRMVAFPGKRTWLGCCLQGSVLIECYLKHVRRISTDRRSSILRSSTGVNECIIVKSLIES